MTSFGHISRPIVLTYCGVGTLVIFSLANLLLLVLLSNHYYFRQSSYNFLSRPTTFRQLIDNPDEPFREYDDADFNELDGCYHVYLDVGSNIGNQVGIIFACGPKGLRHWNDNLTLPPSPVPTRQFVTYILIFNFCLRPSLKLMASGIGMTILHPRLPHYDLSSWYQQTIFK
jgi:hypothetical protein